MLNDCPGKKNRFDSRLRTKINQPINNGKKKEIRSKTALNKKARKKPGKDKFKKRIHRQKIEQM